MSPVHCNFHVYQFTGSSVFSKLVYVNGISLVRWHKPSGSITVNFVQIKVYQLKLKEDN